METLKELSKSYADQCYAVNSAEIGGVLYRETIKDFEAGYKAAFRWISVNDRLPDTGRAVLAMDECTRLVWTSNCIEGRIDSYPDPFLCDLIEATHWREIDFEL